MPPKKAVRKEVLESPDALPDGEHHYYVGGWSYFQSMEDISTLAHDLAARRAAALEAATPEEEARLRQDGVGRTNVLVLPPLRPHTQPDAAPVMELVVMDRMHIEGVAPSVVTRAAGLIRSWAPEPPAAVVDAGAAGRRESEGSERVGQHYGCALPNSEAARVDTAVCVVGVAPHLYVRPRVPEPENVAAAVEPAAGAARRATGELTPSRSRTGSQRRSRSKLTPEQLLEQERQRAEAEALRRRQVEEAVAAAEAETAHLRTFAHPDRWASVELCNLTFAGPVTVRRAHVLFQNCRFCAPGGDAPQLTVSQYCRVSCVSCSFEAPVGGAVYALPTARLELRRCLLTGVAASELSDAGVELPSEAAGQEGDEPAMAELRRLSATLAKSRPMAVGVQADAAQLHMEDCCCLLLATAVALSGRWGASRGAARYASTIRKCTFLHLYGSGVVVHKAGGELLLQQNVFAHCAYYAVDCDGTTRRVGLLGNRLAVDAVLRLREGAGVVVLRNKMDSMAVDENRYENVCLEPDY